MCTHVRLDEDVLVVEQSAVHVENAVQHAEVAELCRDLLAAPADEVGHELVQPRVVSETAQSCLAHLGA